MKYTKLIIAFITIFLFYSVRGEDTADKTDLINDTVAVISLNDFHGAFVKNESQNIPGAGNLYSTIRKIEKRYPCHIVVSAGDNFGGSFFSNLTKGELIPYFFPKAGISISAIGNHEFDNGQAFLKDKWRKTAKEDTLTYVCANLINKKGKIPAYAVPYIVKRIEMPDSTTKKLGIIGLIASSAGSQTKKANVEGLTFLKNYKTIIDSLEENTKLKNINWQILLVHIGTDMKNGKPVWKDQDSENLNSLPSKIKGIASGHSHKVVYGKINGIPVIQGEISGKYIGVLRFVYNRKTKKLTPVDPYVAKVGMSVSDKSTKRKNIDKKINGICSGTKENTTGMALNEKITYVESKEGLPHDRNKDKRNLTALGTYVCMAYTQAYRHEKNLGINDVVLGFSHLGGIRTPLPYGDINVMTAGEVLPFSNKLKIYNMKGKEIFRLIEEGLRNAKGYLQMNNLIVDTAGFHDGTKVVNVRYYVPGKEEIYLSKNKRYPVVVDEFITTGGDGYPSSLFPDKELDKSVTDLETTPSFFKFLKNHPKLSNDTPFRATLKHY